MVVESSTFAERIRQRYPEGLTGIVVMAGTRTTYILDNIPGENDPGKINNLLDYANHIFDLYFDLIKMYLDLGGHNLIIPAFSYQSFYERGDEYADMMIKAFYQLIEENAVSFYRENDMDPYFVGLDTLPHLPDNHPAQTLCRDLQEFTQEWQYDEQRRKLIWEVAPIPLYTYQQIFANADINEHNDLQTKIDSSTDLRELHDVLYANFSRKVYGVELPTPHFYIGSNRNGEMKLRSMYPISMLCGGSFRLYYLPYPTLYLQKNVFQAILNDLAFSQPLRALKKDYSGQFTPEMVEAERQRILELSSNPDAVLGMTRTITQDI